MEASALGSRAAAPDRGGFTLPELVITLSIAATILGMVLPRVDVARYRARTAVLELTTTLNAAQSRAVLEQHDVIIAFDTTAGAVQVHYDTNNDGVRQPEESTRIVQIGEGVLFSRGPAPARPLGARGVTFTRLQDGRPSVVFHRNGSASQAGVVYVVPGTNGVAFPDADYVRAVEVARPTGRATCLRLRGGQWEESC